MIILDKWQKEIIEHDGNVLLCTGRQVGKTYTFAYKIVMYMLKHSKHQILIVSLTEDQAKLIIVMILNIIQQKRIPIDTKNKPTLNKVTLKNGSVALARPVGVTGDAMRGFTGNVLVVDEASRMSPLIWAGAKPTLATTGGQLWLCSTPFGKKDKTGRNTYFYDSFLNRNNRFKVWYKNTPEVYEDRPISTSWTKQVKSEALRFLSEEKKDMSELQYGQEYLGLFLEELNTYFDPELVDKLTILKRPEILDKTNNFMGVDIARMGGDETVYTILHKIGDLRIHQVENIIRTKQYTTVTEREIIALSNLYNCEKVGIDAGSGSLGVGILDRLLENLDTKRKVVAMNNRTISLDRHGDQKQRLFKEDMYDGFRNMMERGDIYLLDDEAIRLSLKSIQMEIQSDKIRIFSSNAHCTEALVRAGHLAKQKLFKFNIHYI